MASVAERAERPGGPPHIVFHRASDAEEAPRTPDEDAAPDAQDVDTERGRLKRRRMSSHSPPRAPSPSRGHDRESGSRHRHHHRKHHRASSEVSLTPPPPSAKKANRRRSDAEPDHTLRGRARNRSESRSRSPTIEGGERELGERTVRKRSQPPSRHRIEEEEEDEGDVSAVRRQRSFPNLYKEGEGKGEAVGSMEGVETETVESESNGEGTALAVQEV